MLRTLDKIVAKSRNWPCNSWQTPKILYKMVAKVATY